ncbi:MAG: DNA double-strand break repair nuclease NurA [Candidatus Aramenus sp.]|nr:DNA double-strand break repair nuclease NurA [Candidatus Aramenus sp.]
MRTKDVLGKIEALAKEESEKLRKLNASVEMVAEDIYYGNVELEFFKVEKEDRPHSASAVDGSMYQVYVGDVFLIMVRAVKVYGYFANKREVPPKVVDDFRVVGDYYGLDAVKKMAITLMLSVETGLMEEEDTDVLFVDGPLVDPPVYSDQIFGKEALDQLISKRSSIFNRKPEKFIGVVKRFSQRFLVNLVGNYPRLEEATERFVVTRLFDSLRKKYSIHPKEPVALGWIDWDEVASREVTGDLEGTKMAYLKYREILGYPILSAYYQQDQISPVSRIDVLGKEGKRNLRFVSTWGVSGYPEVVLLNKIADDLSEIKKIEADAYAKLLFSKIKRNFSPSDIVMMRRSPNDL